MRPILRKGIGANPVKTGLPSVYAPHADAVFVIGSFNDWAEDAP
jgi:1,4-alpha-glucan branching enzyme